jgi:hypothetical protein
MAASRSTAKFWYNPHQGIVRARVSSEMSESEALSLYNEVNGCNLSGLFVDDAPVGSMAMATTAAGR